LLFLGTLVGFVVFIIWLVNNAKQTQASAEARVAAANDEHDLEYLRIRYAKEIYEEQGKLQAAAQAQIIERFHKAFGAK